jgi:hypothetical protein
LDVRRTGLTEPREGVYEYTPLSARRGDAGLGAYDLPDEFVVRRKSLIA